MANKKISELTTATGQTTSWYVPLCDPATGLTYKITAANFSTLIGGGGGDVTAPTVVSAVAATATTIVVTFSESVTVTTAGWSFKKNGSSWTIVNVTGSGTTWTFNMASSASLGDALLRTYDSGTGDTVDASANELVSFTDSSITNSIGDTTAPTVSTATVTTTTNIQIVFSESMSSVTTAGWSFKKNGSAWSISSVSGSGTTWNFTMGSVASGTDTILRSYDSTTGASIDNAANELASFTDQSVTNSLFDSDATAYFTAASITDATEMAAWDAFVVDMKSNSLWTKIYAVWPYLGSTPTKASYNAKNPAAFQITWTGTPTANANGVTGNGSTISGDTGWDPYTNVTPSNGVMIGFYGRNNPGTQQLPMGSEYGSYIGVHIWPNDGAGNGYVCGGKGQMPCGSAQNCTKFHIGGSYSTDNYYYRDGSFVASATGTGNTTFGTESVKVLGCSNGAGIIESDVNLGFSILTYGLSSGDVTTLTNAVNTLMTSLSRNV